MNIFVLDENPFIAAQFMCNKHVVKMVLESAQLLCSVHHLCPYPSQTLPERFYKLTHANHPCAKWSRESIKNYRWLSLHAMGLLEEYWLRYKKNHASGNIIRWCFLHQPNISNFDRTPFVQAMPDEYKQESAVQAYRDYYWFYKKPRIQMKWTVRSAPFWWTKYESLI